MSAGKRLLAAAKEMRETVRQDMDGVEIPEDLLMAAWLVVGEINADFTHDGQSSGNREMQEAQVDIARAILAERERCARIARGDVYSERYRTWPWWEVQKDGTRGNRSRESELVKHCDDIAAAIRKGDAG
jgi:hypothetical protein